MKHKNAISKARLILVKGDYVLLLEKENDTFSIPGGVVKTNETEKGALKREIHEEIGLNINKKEVFYLGSRLKVKPKQLVYKSYYLLQKKDIKVHNREPNKFKSVKWKPWYDILGFLDAEDKSILLEYFATKMTIAN